MIYLILISQDINFSVIIIWHILFILHLLFTMVFCLVNKNKHISHPNEILVK